MLVPWVKSEDSTGTSQEFNPLVPDDGYESDGTSSTSRSIPDFTCDHVYENGRRYHGFQAGRYNFPNDDPEQERENLNHTCLMFLCGGKLHFAPIDDNPQQILDVGTGTGLWVIESTCHSSRSHLSEVS